MANCTQPAGDALPPSRRLRKRAATSMLFLSTGLLVGNSFYFSFSGKSLSESDASKTSHLNKTHHEPVVREADTHHEPVVGKAKIDATIDSIIERFASSDDGFVSGPSKLCEDLVNRANGAEEGREPWRSSGSLLWRHSGCNSEPVDSLGNHLGRWYEARAIASAAGVTIHMDCKSPITDSIPQYWKPSQTVLDNPSSFSWKEACQRSFSDLVYPHESGIGLDHMVGAIRSDLRNMTRTMLSKTAGLEQDDLDEAVIHLRIGDIGRGVNPLYGLVPYYVYTNLIPPSTQTIGIITAPFQQKRDHFHANDPELNEAVVVAARDHIQSKFPHARVSIRNGDETITVTYARMVAARWSFCGSSTFCLFPALATAGESYILQSPLYGGSQGWLNKVVKSFKNVHYIQGKMISSTEYHEWSITDIVHALQREAGD